VGSTSYWQAALETAVDMPLIPIQLLEGDCTTEVAIIGAGVAGSAIALELARAGKAVVVVEGRRIAAGASGRNAGFITNSTGEKYAAVVAHLGRKNAHRLWQFHGENAERAARLIAELAQQGWSCEYQREGMLGLATSESELADIRESARLLNDDGWPTTIWEHETLPVRLQVGYLGGIFHPGSGSLQPAKFVHGLALLARQAGVLFYQESPVHTITVVEDGVILTTPRGRLRARDVVLATNAWLPGIGAQLGADWLARCIVPTRGQVIATEPIAERLFPCPCSADEGYQYWRQHEDGRLIVGGWRNHSLATEATSDETPGGIVQQQLEDFVHKTLKLPEVQITHRWAGIMAFAKDGLPLIGQLPGKSHCFIAGGFTGHGNASALQGATIIRKLLLGRTHEEADLFEPGRFL
jgi:gamma-glutamylputrescine oxidase